MAISERPEAEEKEQQQVQDHIDPPFADCLQVTPNLASLELRRIVQQG
jgi:hypothetical protein